MPGPKHEPVNGPAQQLSLTKSSETSFQEIRDAWELLRSQKVVNVIEKILEQLPRLEQEVETLNDRLRRETENLEHTKAGRFDDFKRQSDTMGSQIAELKKANENLARNEHQLESRTDSLQKENSTLKGKINELEKLNESDRKAMKNKQQELAKVDKQLKAETQRVEMLSQELKTSKADVDQLKQSLKASKDTLDQLSYEQESNLVALKRLHGYSTILDEMSKDTPKILQKYWADLNSLVHEIFNPDLPEDILQGDWTKLQRNEAFTHSIPLPQTNTPLAKSMRTAVVLGTLARLVTDFVFQPTYLFGDDENLRKLLNSEASKDLERESFLRGILLRLSFDQASETAKEVKQFVLEDIFVDALDCILIGPQRDEFQGKLVTWLNNVQLIWISVQHSTRRLEHTFRFETEKHNAWRRYAPPGPDSSWGAEKPINKKDGKGIAILPEIRFMTKDSKAAAPGMVLLQSQVEKAEQEWLVWNRTRDEIAAKEAIGRARGRSVRKQSLPNGGMVKQAFLDAKEGCQES